MKRIMHSIRLLLLLGSIICMIPNNLHSQNITELIYDGDVLYLEGNYFSASHYYNEAFHLDTNRIQNALKYAECCRLFYNYEEAWKMYNYIIARDSKGKHPEAVFWCGMMCKNLEKYSEAIECFQRYIRENKNPKDPLLVRSQLELEASGWAKDAIKRELPVSIVHPGTIINSDFADFNAIQMGDSLIFFSSFKAHHGLPLDTMTELNNLSKIFKSRITPAGFASPEELPSKVDDPGMHNANICFSSNHQLFFFSRCADERRADLKCKIYMVYCRKGKWQKPVCLDNTINYPGATTTQPTVAQGDKEDLLYFVSDRPGGFGGKDIWYAVIKKGKVSKPSNLGSIINTPGDEITPYYDNKSKKLYFSSDYHKGFGGFDVFSSKGSYNQWTTPYNLGYPINTSFNDLYFTVNEYDSSGYLTSNRPGSFYLKNQTCCNDIWEYHYGKKVNTSNLDQKQDTAKSVAKTDSLVNLEKRIQQLLPLNLYFHNDEPDPATTKTSTDKNYSSCVADYYILKEKYQEEYSKGLKGGDKDKARQEIEKFFNEYVLKGMQQLEEFTSLAEKDLESGHSITITIKGFSSPLNSAEYNKNLAKRRIESLINYFREYANGKLLPYLNGTSAAKNRLSFREEPIGEAMASKEVSDNINDKRNSVYSRSAARERRIQILYYLNN